MPIWYLCTALPDGPLEALRIIPVCATASGWSVEGGAGQALDVAILSAWASGDSGSLYSAAQEALERPGPGMADFDRDLALRAALQSQAGRRDLSVSNAQQNQGSVW